LAHGRDALKISPRRQSATAKDVLEEIRRRQGAIGFNAVRLERLCFGPQLAYVLSKSRRQVVRCSRRAGKTWGIAAKLLYHAVAEPYAHQAYIAPTLKQARRIFWPTLKRINAEHRVGGKPNEAECFMEFRNGARIYVGGAKDQAEADSLRGLALKNCIVDEAQSARPSILQSLLNEIIEPALIDYSGGLDVVGTPGAVPAGYFHSIDVGDLSSSWEHHNWTMADNVELPARKAGRPVEDLLREVREHHGWTEANQTYRREWLGEWVADTGALMLHYDSSRNACDWASAEDDWSYVVGFDVGFDDADAISVLGWQRHSRVVHLVFERVAAKQTISTLADQLTAVIARYRPIRVVGDFGGLGKKIASELQTRWQLPVEAADKMRKAEHVALLDDALVTGRFKAPPKSRFADDCSLLQWDATQRAKGVFKEAESFHSDSVDSCLYAFRVALAHFEAPAPVKAPDDMRLFDLATRERPAPTEWWDDDGLGGLGDGEGW
jgi:hypothetical protein